jgi:hypothetical protein
MADSAGLVHILVPKTAFDKTGRNHPHSVIRHRQVIQLQELEAQAALLIKCQFSTSAASGVSRCMFMREIASLAQRFARAVLIAVDRRSSFNVITDFALKRCALKGD